MAKPGRSPLPSAAVWARHSPGKAALAPTPRGIHQRFLFLFINIIFLFILRRVRSGGRGAGAPLPEAAGGIGGEGTEIHPNLWWVIISPNSPDTPLPRPPERRDTPNGPSGIPQPGPRPRSAGGALGTPGSPLGSFPTRAFL